MNLFTKFVYKDLLTEEKSHIAGSTIAFLGLSSKTTFFLGMAFLNAIFLHVSKTNEDISTSTSRKSHGTFTNFKKAWFICNDKHIHDNNI